MERKKYFDEAKGAAILLMVAGHPIAWNFPDWRQAVLLDYEQSRSFLAAGFLWQLIYSFHMALLFMISGLLLNVNGFWGSIRKKTVRLLVPYIFTGFIMLLIKNYYGYWFLFSLWLLSLIGICMVLICSIVNKKKQVWIDALITVMFYFVSNFILSRINLQPFGDVGKTTDYIIPYFVGVFFSRHKDFFDRLTSGVTPWVVLFSFCFFIKYSPFFGYSGIVFDIIMILNRYSLLSILGSLMVVSFFKKGVPEKVSDVLSNIGKNSLENYILHLLFVIQIPSVGLFWLHTSPVTCVTTQMVYSLLIGGISIVFSLIFAWSLKRSKLFSLILFGK